MPDLSHIALGAASLFFASAVVTTLWIATRRTKADRLRDQRRAARYRARTARIASADFLPLPANDANPEPRHAARPVTG